MSLTSGSLKWIAGAVAIVAAVLVVRSVWSAKDAEWQERVEREVARAEAAIEVGDSLRAEARYLSLEADSLIAEAAIKDTVIVTMLEQLPAPPPDCEPFTAPRDSAILVMQERHDNVASAFARERESNIRLRQAEAKAAASTDSLLAVLDSRPRPLSPLIPEVGVGVFAGICTTGQPCAGLGVGVQWKVRLF